MKKLKLSFLFVLFVSVISIAQPVIIEIALSYDQKFEENYPDPEQRINNLMNDVFIVYANKNITFSVLPIQKKSYSKS